MFYILRSKFLLSKHIYYCLLHYTRFYLSVIIKRDEYGGLMKKTAGNALISVYDKTDIAKFAGGLRQLGWKIYASGGTYQSIAGANIPVTDVAELVGGKAILGHKVVTLSREISAGLLANMNDSHEMDEMKRLKIPIIHLVCQDSYPLESEIAKPIATPASVLEQSDIGGPNMLRAAAKGGRIVLSVPEQRDQVLKWLGAGKPDEKNFIRTLADRAVYEVARYTAIEASYWNGTNISTTVAKKFASTKYGENPQQTNAGLYADNRINPNPLGIDQFQHIKGWELSYVNETDIMRLVQTSTHIAAGFDRNFGKIPSIAVGVKHGNTCGAGIATTHVQAVKKMLSGDIRAIFGGVVMINGVINTNVAKVLLNYLMTDNNSRLLDGVIGASVTDNALKLLDRQKMRVVINPALNNLNQQSLDKTRLKRFIIGGVLEQPNYEFVMDFSALLDSHKTSHPFGDTSTSSKGIFSGGGDPVGSSTTEKWLMDGDSASENAGILRKSSQYVQLYGHLTDQQKHDLILAWAVGSTSNSNTITLVKNGMVIGNGTGQQDRIGAAQLAISRSTIELPTFDNTNGKLVMNIHLDKEKLDGAVAYSDSFFPFADGPLILAQAGIRAILTTSGSVADKNVIKTLKHAKISLVMVPDQIGRGFFGH